MVMMMIIIRGVHDDNSTVLSNIYKQACCTNAKEQKWWWWWFVVLTPRNRYDDDDGDGDDDGISSLLWKRKIRQTCSGNSTGPKVHVPKNGVWAHDRISCTESLHDTPTTQHRRSRAHVTDMHDIWSHTDISISWWTRLYPALKCQRSLNVSHIQVTQPARLLLSPVTINLPLYVISIFSLTKLEQAGTCDHRAV